MKTAALTALALVVLLWGGNASPQELATDIYPSEDEIYNALLTGEISYQQYLVLKDLITNGLDSTNRHLLDEIPNLSFFNIDSISLRTSLENDQQKPFETDTSEPRLAGRIDQGFATYADESGRAKSITRMRLNFNKAVTADFKIRRDYNHRKYFAGRSITFHGEGVTREIILGNFSQRYGLGTVFGHRGKLFSISSDLDSDSFLFPEYGGRNGASVHLSFGKYQVRGLGSVIQSDHTRLSSWGGMIEVSDLPLMPTVAVGTTRLKNRSTGEFVEDTKLGVTGRYNYRRGYAALEMCWQTGESDGFAALVTEGRHRFRQAEIKYAGWRYEDGYVDLTGGGKAAAMYHNQVFESIDRDYSTKRNGQQGMLVKTVVDLSDRVELANSLLYASFNSDTTNTQWLAQLSRNFGDLSLSLDFLSRGRTRSENSTVSRQVRFVARWRAEKLYLRTYAGYNTQTSENDFVSLFVSLRYNLDSDCQFELWSNISEIDHSQGRINHWYAYAKSSISIAGRTALGMKLSHTYSRGTSTEHRTIVGIDLSCCF